MTLPIPDLFASSPPLPGLRPVGAGALLALQAGLAVREQARSNLAEAVAAEDTAERHYSRRTADPLAALDRKSRAGRTLAARRFATAAASDERALAADRIENVFAAKVLPALLGTGEWCGRSTCGLDREVQDALARVCSGIDAAQFYDHVTGYRLRHAKGEPAWRNYALTTQPYMDDASLIDAVNAINIGRHPFSAAVLPASWGWYAPDNPMTKLVLIFGREHRLASTPNADAF